MGSECYSQIEADFYQDLYDAGILVFAAAGNDGDGTFTYPASLPTVISVASSDSNQQWDESQKNDQIELTAPGTDIMSTLPNGKYGAMSGTAMSAAHVGGVAGLLWMYFPSCTNSQIRAVLAKTALDLGESGCEETFGYGLVQAKAAYTLLDEGNCGGDIGSTTAVGGCLQLKSPVLLESCSSNLDCDDNDPCTVDTCQDSVCSYDHDCAGCGLSSLITVDIKTDDFPEETTWEILDYTTSERVMANVEGGYGNCGRKYTKSQCVGDGGYLFVIYDSEGDGLCCEYGRGTYEVKVGDERKVLGAEFESIKSHFFSVFSPSTSSFSPTKTKSPAASPSASPTSSPTITTEPTAVSCVGRPNKITVDIETDFHPEETSWVIKDFETDEEIARSPKYNGMAHKYSTQICVDKGSYIFSIHDSADDGICCTSHSGSYTVSVDGVSKATGGEFKSAAMHLISIDDTIATSDPNNSIPTYAPTLTESPTGTPTDSQLPSFTPSDVPTLMPSTTPSSSPSSSPSYVPTAWCAQVMGSSQECNSELVDEPPICCGDLVCYGDKCVPACSAEGEASLECDATLDSDYPKLCCPGLVCREDKKCGPPPKNCAGGFQTAKDCKKNAPDSAEQSCCIGFKCGDLGFCETYCGDMGESSLQCDPNLGPDSPLQCCEGLECNDNGKCSWPKTCARPGETSKCCKHKKSEFDSCCRGLVCNEDKKCVESKSISKFIHVNIY